MSAAVAALMLASRGRRPSRSFCAVLRAVAELDGDGGGYTRQITERAHVERAIGTRLLYRMLRMGLVYRWHEDGDVHELKRALRVYYRLTVAGREVADEIMTGVA